jgi:hypothetical protein
MSNHEKPESDESDMDGFMHQPNLDQDEQDKWLASRTRQQISDLARRTAAMFREAEEAGRVQPASDEST